MCALPSFLALTSPQCLSLLTRGWLSLHSRALAVVFAGLSENRDLLLLRTLWLRSGSSLPRDLSPRCVFLPSDKQKREWLEQGGWPLSRDGTGRRQGAACTPQPVLEDAAKRRAARNLGLHIHFS